MHHGTAGQGGVNIAGRPRSNRGKNAQPRAGVGALATCGTRATSGRGWAGYPVGFVSGVGVTLLVAAARHPEWTLAALAGTAAAIATVTTLLAWSVASTVRLLRRAADGRGAIPAPRLGVLPTGDRRVPEAAVARIGGPR